MIRYWLSPTTVPITSDRKAQTRYRFVYTPSDEDRTDPIPRYISSRSTKIEILGITVSHVVTIVGVPSYTSGAQ